MRIEVIDADTVLRSWWVLVLRGAAGIIFGVVTFVAPGLSLAGLVLAFGAYAFSDGVLTIVAAVRRRRTDAPWWVLLIEGLLGVVAGAVTLFWPGITALALLYVIAAWALVTGVLEVIAAIRLRKVISGEWLLALSGIASIALAVVLMLFPGQGALALVMWIGAYALLFGALLIALGLSLRSWKKRSLEAEAPATNCIPRSRRSLGAALAGRT